MPPARLAQLALAALRTYPQRIPGVLGAMALEGVARLAGTLDTLSQYSHHIWKPVRSTKAIERSHSLRVLAVRLDSADMAATLAAAQQVPTTLGNLHWWDAEQGTLIFQLASADADAALLNTLATLPGTAVCSAHMLSIATAPTSSDDVVLNERALMPLRPLTFMEMGD
jgi:hypothetical protein